MWQLCFWKWTLPVLPKSKSRYFGVPLSFDFCRFWHGISLLYCVYWPMTIERFSNLSLFLQVLATGLSGRYSELPRKFDILSDDWHQLRPDDIDSMPDLSMFLNSLEFCNAVVQASHSYISVSLEFCNAVVQASHSYLSVSLEFCNAVVEVSHSYLSVSLEFCNAIVQASHSYISVSLEFCNAVVQASHSYLSVSLEFCNAVV